MTGNDLIEAWNALPTEIRKVKIVNQARTSKIALRLKDPVFKKYALEAIQKVGESSFCRGYNGRAWLADFDWFLQPAVLTKIIEGRYDDRAPTSRQPMAGIEPKTALVRSVMDCDSIIKTCEQQITEIKNDGKNKHCPEGSMGYVLRPEALARVKELRGKIDAMRKRKEDFV